MLKSTIILCSLVSCAVYAQTKVEKEAPVKETAKEEVAEKPIDLFDGKTLTGWKKVGGDGEFKVEDGCIVGFGKNISGNTFLITEKSYTDYDFTYEFKFDDLTGNSGLMFRAAQKPGENGRVFGYQCEADNTKRSWTAGLFDEARRGWLFPRQKDKLSADHRKWFSAEGNEIFKSDDWNTIRIRCKGNHIQTWLNGAKRVDFVDTDKQHDTRSGFFGLQVHGGKSCNVRWRNLKLTPLK